jgi:hypothetical protein
MRVFIVVSIIIKLKIVLDFKEEKILELSLLNLEMDEEKERRRGIKPTIS